MKCSRLALLVLLLATATYTQTVERVMLTGTIFDPAGAVVPKTRVRATNPEGRYFETYSNSEGTYQLQLPVKQYQSGKLFLSQTYDIALFGPPGFKRTDLNGFKVVSSYTGKMALDLVLDIEVIDHPIVNERIIEPPRDKVSPEPIKSRTAPGPELSRLTGVVYDQQGAVMPGIEVWVNGKNFKETMVRTDETGAYKVEVPAGYYDIRFDHRSGNYVPVKFKRYFISPSYKGNMNLDVSLKGKMIEDTFGVDNK